MLAGAYDQPPLSSDVEIHAETMKLGRMVEPLGFEELSLLAHRREDADKLALDPLEVAGPGHDARSRPTAASGRRCGRFRSS